MNPTLKRWLLLAAKVAIAVCIYFLIFDKILGRENIDELWARLADVSWAWVGVGALSLCCAISCSVVRWRKLLVGQGIHAPYRHLLGSFMIGRFFGAVTPGGFTGLNGYRIYDIARHTGKTARSVASIGIEMVLGNLAMGVVAFAACFFGYRYVGAAGMAVLFTVFASLIGAALLVLWKPALVRTLVKLLPGAVQARVQSLIDAVCAYEGKGMLLFQAACLGVGTHTFNSLIYVCSAQALHVELSVGEVFFVSTLQIVATLVPVSPNGVGLREATAIAFYRQVGVPTALGVLIPNVGFVFVEMAISALGGLWLVARGKDYKPEIQVDDMEREQQLDAQIERVEEAAWPRVGRGAAIGLGAGLLAGLLIGVAEAWAVVSLSQGRTEPDVWFYGALSYALFCGVSGMLGGAFLSFVGRRMERRAVPEPAAFAHLTGLIAAAFTFVIGAFRIKRDVFHEELVWKSGQGLGVLVGALIASAVVYGLLFFLLRALTTKSPARIMLKPVGSLGLTALVAAATLAIAFMNGDKAAAFKGAGGAGPAEGGKVLFIVVDTLRADHLPAYGYKAGKTPNLDAFAKDAVRFENAYANASWTRPSFASLLTGRYASSHGVMSKAASLPEGAETLAERFSAAGYATAGVITNYNVAPFFNFQQGFDRYTYLTPNFLFGASDTAAKLSLLQIFKRVDEKTRAKLGKTAAGSAYQDAARVNESVFSFLDAAPGGPWLMFAGYMDPHDPYFTHPYDGFGYSRAAHIKPDPADADKLRKLYDGEITFWDQHFGALVRELKRRGLYDELTLVITSDHGEEFMDHGGFWHGTTLYEEQLHVPLFVKLPKNARGGEKVSHWVESVDIMPTLLALEGLEVPEAVQGIDLFRGKEQTFAEESHDGNVLQATRVRRFGAELKLIKANAGNPRGLKEMELYRTDTDPREQRELSEADPDALAASDKALKQASQQARTGALKAKDVDLSMDQAAQDRLKALGYAGE